MSVTIDTTVAGSSANSYITLAEMEIFVSEQIPGDAVTAWAALTDAQKNAYIVEACRQIDRAFRWAGGRVTDYTGEDAQALCFPRVSLRTRSGKINVNNYRSGDDYEIDPRIIEAQKIQTLHLVDIIAVSGGSALSGSTRAKLQAEGVKAITIGNTSETYTGKTSNLHPAIKDLLRALIRRTRSI